MSTILAILMIGQSSLAKLQAPSLLTFPTYNFFRKLRPPARSIARKWFASPFLP